MRVITALLSLYVLLTFVVLQWTAQQQLPHPNDRMSKCQTSTFPQTRFCSCRTYQKASRKNNSCRYSLSQCFSYSLSKRSLFNDTSNRYSNFHEVRLIPTKKDIAFVEFLDERNATIAKDTLHNYKLDGENKIKVGDSFRAICHIFLTKLSQITFARK